MIVRLQLTVRAQPDEDQRSPLPVYELDVHVPADVADVITALVMRSLADSNATDLTLPRPIQ